MKNKIKWIIDSSHSQLGFKVKHLMISNIKGMFKTYEASILTADDDFSSVEMDVRIDSDSIETGDEDRDRHVKGKDFFDCENHRKIIFSDTSIEKSFKEGDMELWGNLTMKGITKRIKLIVEYGGMIRDSHGNARVGFTVTGMINRKDWQLNWNIQLETGGFMVGDEVNINCDIQLIRSTQNELQKKNTHLKKQMVN
jgi:polyisoprenoid-binding protein YceI